MANTSAQFYAYGDYIPYYYPAPYYYQPWYQPPSIFQRQQGWECPVCGAGLAPWVSVCYYHAITTTTTATSEEE